jgi:hypothetical protein
MVCAKYFRLFLILILLVYWVEFSEAHLIFVGKWESIEHVTESEKPYSVLDLSLSEDEAGGIQGSYCFVTQYGNRVDCGLGGEVNINGRVIPNHLKKAVVNFDSFFRAKNGVAELSVNDDGSMTWNVVAQPKAGDYYGPNRAVFRKVVSEAGMHSGEKLVIADEAYLYDEPSLFGRHKECVIKGDHVKLIGVSADLKFWRVEFKARSGKLLKKWIDCRDIDFCAK